MLLRYGSAAAVVCCSLFLIFASGSCSHFKKIGQKYPDSTSQSSTTTSPSTTQSSTQPSTTQSSTQPSTTQSSDASLPHDVASHALRKMAATEPDPDWWPKT